MQVWATPESANENDTLARLIIKTSQGLERQSSYLYSYRQALFHNSSNLPLNKFLDIANNSYKSFFDMTTKSLLLDVRIPDRL